MAGNIFKDAWGQLRSDGPATAKEMELKQAQAEQQMRKVHTPLVQLGAAVGSGGLGGYGVYDPNIDAVRYPSGPTYLHMRFREVEGGYLASYSLAEGEILKEVLCPTLQDVANIVLRMAAEKAMR